MKPVFRYWIIATLVIWILTLVTCKSSIEEDLTSRSKQTLDTSNSEWANITATGRDLVLEGEALNNAQAESIVTTIEEINGVRVVENATTTLASLLDRANSALKANSIDWVSVDGDTETLTLSGEALIQNDINMATQSVDTLRGLKTLNNNITLLAPLPIRAKTKLEIDAMNWVQVEGNNTELTLTGEALAQGEIEAVLDSVSGLRGLKNLENKLTILAPLKQRARSALNAAGFNWVNVDGENNHLTLTGDAFSKQASNDALASLNQLRGLERLTNNINLLTPLKDRAQSVLDENNIKWANFKLSNNDITLSGSTIDVSVAEKLTQQMSTLVGVGQVKNNITILGKLSAVDCQTSINQLLNSNKIEFETGSANINSKSLQLLSRLANTSRQCPQATIVVMGHTDNTGDEDSNVKLSKKRSLAVVNNLTAKGVAATRLTAVGLGPWYPIESNKTEEGRQKNRRIEFKVN